MAADAVAGRPLALVAPLVNGLDGHPRNAASSFADSSRRRSSLGGAKAIEDSLPDSFEKQPPLSGGRRELAGHNLWTSELGQSECAIVTDVLTPSGVALEVVQFPDGVAERTEGGAALGLLDRVTLRLAEGVVGVVDQPTRAIAGDGLERLVPHAGLPSVAGTWSEQVHCASCGSSSSCIACAR